MSLINLLRKKSRKLLFTTPSHGQKFFIFNKFRQFYKYDVSETDTHNPQGALLQAEKKASEVYSTGKTLFLTNGSTSGVIASVLSCVKSDDNVLIWRNSHLSHLNAVRLAGAKPVFYDLPMDAEFNVPTRTAPELIEKFLKLNKISAVIITSPTYEGFVSDVKRIKSVCQLYGTFLIVDEAHGALYPFSEKLPQSAVNIADFTIQSLHKTAGGLNPTALLHTNTDLDVRKFLNIINTTSPSYPLLTSIEANINYLNSLKGKNKINKLVENITALKAECTNCSFGGDDITKILVKKTQMSGYEISEKLYKEFNIEDEKTNEISTMLLCGVGTTKNYLQKLKTALNKL